MRIISKIFGVIAGMSAMPALAQDGLEIIGIPIDRGLGFQPAVTELARDLQWLDAMILYIITAIVVFVTALMGYVIIRYNWRANPNPASFTHNSPVEIAWTVIPVLILTVIGVYSLPVLFKQQEIPEAEQGAAILDQLYGVIEQRRGADPAESWTARLMAKGLPKICQKVGEEATETVVAALAETHQDLLEESADLLYHLLVLWAAKGVKPDEVYDVLYRRRVTTDIKKKKQRKNEKK